MKTLKILIASLILIFVLGGIAFAQEIPEVIQDEEVSVKDLGISEPKILPDNPFYFLKNWLRGIELFFAFNPVKKAELRLKFANEKIFEAKKMAEEKKDPKMIEKGVEDFQKEMEKIGKMDPKILKEFSEKLIHQQILHQKILEKLETQVPPEVFEKIKENREKHLERFAQVMQKVEEKEKIAERLEKELEKIKGSKFKEFKDLEFLDEIEKRMPEDIKKKIEEKKAQITEKFREKLEGMEEKEKERFKTYLDEISGNKLKHLEIISNLESEEISEKLSDVLEKAKEKKIEGVEKEAISADRAQSQIKKAEDEIIKAEEKVSKISEEEYGGRAARKLLDLSKKHLEEAKRAFGEKKYGRAFGLATASYHEALNAERIVQKIEEIKKSPEKMKEKFEKLYPGIELPKDITKCEIPLMKKCKEGETLRVEKTEEGCPIFKCVAIEKPEMPEIKKPEEKIVCPMLWNPVCGKDGKTYSNECFAKVAGVEINYKGACKEMPKPLEEKIKIGSWAKYSVPQMTVPEVKIVDWIRVEIIKIEREKITESITYHYKDGSTETETITVDISREADYVASPNLNVGDSRETLPPGGTITVKKILTKIYGGKEREAACYENELKTHKGCYDRKTGILLEMEDSVPEFGIMVKLILESTNIW